MERRHFLTSIAAAGVAAGATGVTSGLARVTRVMEDDMDGGANPAGRIPVAFLISEHANVMDLAGPWEVFQDVMLGGSADHGEQMPFELFTVGETREPVTATAGLTIVPNHTFETAPRPKVIVVGAQHGRSERLLTWLREASARAEVTMSVCTGAFVLGRAGLLKGKSATTHHEFLDDFARTFPDVALKRGVRFVENDRVATAAGLTSGIDLALRVVERYYGREVALRTATYMEYESRRWNT
jgi:transcriptional regulator GlxA family with amidase domain